MQLYAVLPRNVLRILRSDLRLTVADEPVPRVYAPRPFAYDPGVHSLSLVIFRRDLRAEDNAALIKASESSERVLPCFIADDRQITDANAYRSVFGQRFLVESLADLDEDIREKKGRLYLFRGEAEDVVGSLLDALPIDAVYVNRDYTPFSVKRDAALADACEKRGRTFVARADALLHEPEDVFKDDGKPYTVFTPFWRKAAAIPVPAPKKLPKTSFYTDAVDLEWTDGIDSLSPALPGEPAVRGGRAAGLAILNGIKAFRGYEVTRDAPILPTTHLSAHLKFGTVSVREAFHAVALSFGESHPLLRQFYWRDFFTHVAFHFPAVFGHAFQKKYDAVPWDYDGEKMKAFAESRTGFPIVDAAMRELTTTGFMHNRARMVVASFFTKDLHLDWREGEKLFANYLVDYDPCVNNGNWQWAASTGCDAQPYFRIFNPWLQQEKFDPDAAYVKKWLPELADLEPKAIHAWHKRRDGFTDYPAPMLDHAVESAKAKAAFAAVR